MDLQAWLAPTFVGVVLGIIATLVTGQLTRRHAVKMWHLDREAQRQDSLRTEGLKLANVALTQLNTLREDLPYTVFGRHDEERDERCRTALDELERVMLIMPDRALREHLCIVRDVLSRPDDIVQWGVPSFDPRRVAGVGSKEGIDAVTAYIRGDAVPEPSNTLREMHTSYQVAMEQLAVFHEEHEQAERERRRTAANGD